MTDPAERIRLAARATLRGWAEVAVHGTSDLGNEHRSFCLTGRADFAGDQCFLTGDEETLIYVGGAGYQLLEGRWHRRKARPGRRDPGDPRWLLGLFADHGGVHSVREEPSGEVHGELDAGLAADTLTWGLCDEWQPRFTARLYGGRVRTMRVEIVNARSQTLATMHTFELRHVSAIAPIELPPARLVISAPGDSPDEESGAS